MVCILLAKGLEAHAVEMLSLYEVCESAVGEMSYKELKSLDRIVCVHNVWFFEGLYYYIKCIIRCHSSCLTVQRYEENFISQRI